MPIHNCLRCSNTLCMYDIDVGCSLKGSTPSTIVSWDHFHIYIILSQIWGNLCGGNGMNVLPYPHPQLLRCSNTLCLYWDHFHTDIVLDFSNLSQIWGNLCGGNGVSVLPYTHPQLFNSLTAIRVPAGTKNSRPVGFLQ